MLAALLMSPRVSQSAQPSFDKIFEGKDGCFVLYDLKSNGNKEFLFATNFKGTSEKPAGFTARELTKQILTEAGLFRWRPQAG